MDFIRQLGSLVLDHRFRRLTESLLKAADEIYAGSGLTFRARWASTYMILRDDGPAPVGEVAQRLRLTHPAIIGITDEMIDAGLAEATRDKEDGRRRIIGLTDKGSQMSDDLTRVWDAMTSVQASRFRTAGCEIIDVLNAVEDGMSAKSISVEVLDRVARARNRSADRKARMARRGRAAVRTLALLTAMSAVLAVARQAAAQPPAAIGPAEKAALVKALSDSLVGGYIYEKTGRMMADSIGVELRGGAYDAYSSGEGLAQKLTETLRRISKDRHLGVRFGLPASGGGPVLRRMAPNATPGGPPRRVVRITGDSVSASNPPVPTPPSMEYGIAKAEILPGNIGYLDVRGFSGDPGALRVVDSVMAMFASVDALIIDVGRNSGGGPQVIQHLSAYLFDKPTHLVSSIARGMDAPRERWTSPNVPGKRIPKTPVYILTSRRTFSAAESFTFGLRNNGRVTVVGEPTGGGGHFGDFIPLAGQFSMFLPRGRTFDPRTDKGWEAEGIKPDVEVLYDGALDKALELARRR